MEEYGRIAPYLLRAKELYDGRCCEIAARLKGHPYHMVVGSGMLWGEAYDYAMCILEEMLWRKTSPSTRLSSSMARWNWWKRTPASSSSMGEDETRPLMDRVKRFADKFSEAVNVFDTKDVELPFTKPGFRKIVSPLVIYALMERLSCHLEKELEHPLTTRRYYRQMEY